MTSKSRSAADKAPVAATLAGVETLTNKTLTAPTITGAGAAAFGNLSYTGTLTGGTGVVNLGSGQLYKDASGNVGIGTSSPVNRLDVLGDVTVGGFYRNVDVTVVGAASMLLNLGARSGSTLTPGAALGGLLDNPATTGAMQFYTRSSGALTERMRITSAGNVGIGTSSPGTLLDVVGSSSSGSAGIYPNIRVRNTNTTTQSLSDFQVIAENGAIFGQFAAVLSGGERYVRVAALTNHYLQFMTNSAERMRIDSSGNVVIAGTTPGAGFNFAPRFTVDAAESVFKATQGQDAYCARFWNSASSGNNLFLAFATEGSPVTRGSITYNRGAGLVAYTTTSDYRAKDISGPITDSGAVIDSVPVYMGKMKGATQERPMFIAHETPDYAHTGEKDAIDKDGNPVYQQMDASALVPVMWAELQSLRARVAQLEGN